MTKVTYNPNRGAYKPGFGDYGPIPTTPCLRCEGEWFVPVGDWNMGYRCSTCFAIWFERK